MLPIYGCCGRRAFIFFGCKIFWTACSKFATVTRRMTARRDGRRKRKRITRFVSVSLPAILRQYVYSCIIFAVRVCVELVFFLFSVGDYNSFLKRVSPTVFACVAPVHCRPRLDVARGTAHGNICCYCADTCARSVRVRWTGRHPRGFSNQIEFSDFIFV